RIVEAQMLLSTSTRNMKRRSLIILFVLAACGGDDSSSAATQLDGTYRPADAGEIKSITFSRGADYLLMPGGCASSSCASIGTYRIDGDSLVLDDAKTGEERRLALEVMKTSAPQPLVKTVMPRDLVQPGQTLEQPGQQTTTGNGQQ